MIKISNMESTLFGGKPKCPFGGQCVGTPEEGYYGGVKCDSIIVEIDGTDQLEQAGSLGLHPDRTPDFSQVPFDRNAAKTSIEICEKATRKPDVIQNLRTLLAAHDRIFVDDPEELAGRQEAARVHEGDVVEIDEIQTDHGLQALERVTSQDSRAERTSVRLAVVEGVLQTVAIYD